MQLEEMRMARKMGQADPDLQASLEQAKRKFDVLLEAVDEDLRTEWQAWDAGGKSTRLASQKVMVALLDRRRYLSNLVRDVNETLEIRPLGA
jgi:molecular chaperone HscB